MTVIRDVHEAHGASFDERGGRTVVGDYGRPDRTVGAVRRVVGVTEAAYGVLSIAGEDRLDYVDNAVSNAVPREESEGSYALLLDPDGRIRTDLYAYHAGERLLLFVPPGQAEPLAEDWRGKVFVEDVEIDVATDDFGVFGVHGPKATEKIASVLTGGTPPEEPLTFVRGRFDDAGVTVLRTDAPAGEEGYEIVCAADDAATVFDVLVNYGLNAAPFGRRAWDVLTLEAGTPLFASELDGRLPNVVGVRNALDFEKGCYVGQEVVSRIENRGAPNERLVGLRPETVPDAGAAVTLGDEAVGEVTRGGVSPTVDGPVSMAVVDADVAPGDAVDVQVAGETVPGAVAELPFVEGSDRSARVPSYP